MTEPQDTIETSEWTVRQIALATYYQAIETNGWVRDLRQDMYGNEARKIVGLKQMALDNTAYRERLKVGVRIAMTVAGATLTLLSALLVLIVEHVL